MRFSKIKDRHTHTDKSNNYNSQKKTIKTYEYFKEYSEINKQINKYLLVLV